MRQVSGFGFRASGFVLLVLVLLPLAGSACTGERAGNAGSEKGHAASGQASGDVAAKGTGATGDSSVQAGASAGAIGGAGQYRHSCRIQSYIVKEGMSKAEVKRFDARVTYRVQANLDGGGDKNLGELLDDIDVPAYRGLCG
jgi:hypothetical protein